MSSRASTAATANTHTPVASATTTQTRIRPREDDDAEEEKQTAQSSAHVSPAMRIYRHALESIFAMLNLHDLTQILGVSRSWSAAVRSMQSIGATIERRGLRLEHEGKVFRPLPPIQRLTASPLLRHLAAIHITHNFNRATPLTSESLALLAQHARHLTSLWCHLTLTPPPAPLVWPASLASLHLQLSGEPSPGEMNRMLSTLAALPSLQRLVLRSHATGVDLGLLGASRSLRDLTHEDLCEGYPQLSDSHVAQLRSSLGHVERIALRYLDSDKLARLLQPPHALRWQDIGCVFGADARTGDLLASLPTLTMLNLNYAGDAPHADFLSKLPLLSSLQLACLLVPSAASVLASVQSCTRLTELELRCMLDPAHVRPLLTALSKLRTLKLWGDWSSLQCFASCPAAAAARNLEELSFYQSGPPLQQTELAHMHAMQGLRRLELERVFESLDDAAVASLSPPTAHLPRLTRFVHTNARDRSRLERTGPSFEWMQQRLVQ